MADNPRLFRPVDALILAAVLAAGGVTLPWLWTGTGRSAVVKVEGKKTMRLHLEGETRGASVAGKLGPVALQWSEAGVRVSHAPCSNQLCVQTGFIRRQGYRIVCVPSRLEIEVEGGAAIFDAVTF